jgi:ribosomal protein L29
MKYAQIKEMQTSDLEKKLKETQFELVKLTTASSSGAAAKNPGLIRVAKKTIAKILTEMHARSMTARGN